MGTGKRKPVGNSRRRRERKLKQPLLELPAWQTGLLIYADCGARNEVTNPLVDLLPEARYVGFEPDQIEYARLCQQEKKGYSYFPIAVGKDSETRTLYLTRNPECSSLLEPNYAFFGSFTDCAPQIEVMETREVRTVALDSYLPTVGIHHIDFLKLDTQGTELEILQGAESFLSSSILGLKVEVEFSPMYLDQPLFADVDAYIRQFGFMLFDLLRHRYRRQSYPRDLDTRGQLLYGDAFYLKDYHCLADKGMKAEASKLAIIAAFHGFHDYALETIDFLLAGKAGSLSSEEKESLDHARLQYVSSIAKQPWWVNLMQRLARSPLRGLFRLVGLVGKRLEDGYKCATVKRNFNWSD